MARRTIDTLWGSTGATTDPGDAKMNLGWVTEIPTHQVQNFWQLRVEEMLQWIEQHGIQDWSSLTIYADLGLCLGSNGVVYQSQQAANTNHQPVADAGTWWEQANFSVSLVAGGGYIILGGDTPFILQWGSQSVAGNTVGVQVTLPLAYPTAHAVAVGSHKGNSSDVDNAYAVVDPTLPLTKIELGNANGTAQTVWWMSLGW